ncbi:DUF6308 family protein [Arthrobacter sp. NPDC058192]|uniref:DUF6308 family protein n=1 Tax=Arthrobacter sp. NPDC058192 TaxID=3346372 RepID=UPI0036E03235
MTTQGDGSGITSALAAISDDAALNYLNQYFGQGEWTGQEFTGAHFDSFGNTETDKVTAGDIVAVACLSIHVPARAAIAVLGEQRNPISCHLHGISKDDAIEDIPFDEHDQHFGEDSPADRLWQLLRAHHRVGATTASKIMARKRPALIPIFDSVVGNMTGFPDAAGTWRAWHHAFSTDVAFTSRLRSLRAAARLDHLSLLRVLDVVLWMHGTHGVGEPERVDGAEEV